jgi:hypothetical protein
MNIEHKKNGAVKITPQNLRDQILLDSLVSVISRDFPPEVEDMIERISKKLDHNE